MPETVYTQAEVDDRLAKLHGEVVETNARLAQAEAEIQALKNKTEACPCDQPDPTPEPPIIGPPPVTPVEDIHLKAGETIDAGYDIRPRRVTYDRDLTGCRVFRCDFTDHGKLDLARIVGGVNAPLIFDRCRFGGLPDRYLQDDAISIQSDRGGNERFGGVRFSRSRFQYVRHRDEASEPRAQGVYWYGIEAMDIYGCAFTHIDDLQPRVHSQGAYGDPLNGNMSVGNTLFYRIAQTAGSLRSPLSSFSGNVVIDANSGGFAREIIDNVICGGTPNNEFTDTSYGFECQAYTERVSGNYVAGRLTGKDWIGAYHVHSGGNPDMRNNFVTRDSLPKLKVYGSYRGEEPVVIANDKVTRPSLDRILNVASDPTPDAVQRLRFEMIGGPA